MTFEVDDDPDYEAWYEDREGNIAYSDIDDFYPLGNLPQALAVALERNFSICISKDRKTGLIAINTKARTYLCDTYADCARAIVDAVLAKEAK